MNVDNNIFPVRVFGQTTFKDWNNVTLKEGQEFKEAIESGDLVEVMDLVNKGVHTNETLPFCDMTPVAYAEEKGKNTIAEYLRNVKS